MREEQESYDVVVCGGGLAGFSAAVAAARHGASTVLIQERPVLGGNSSSEVRVTPHGAAAFHAYARESGVVSEALIAERAINHETITENGWTNSLWDMVLYDIVTRTPNLTVHLNTTVVDVVREGDRVSAVEARVLGAETTIHVAGGVFIDCTGDGTVAAAAGAQWRTGCEGRAEFDEPHASPEPHDGVMGSSLHFKTVDAGRPVPFEAPEWAVHYDDEEFFYQGGRVPKTLKSGYWWIEVGPPWNTIYDNEVLRHELTRHLLGVWDYFKNRNPKTIQRARNLALDWYGQVPGKRESRRVIGRRLVTENDLIGKTVFDDEVAFGGWYVDLHTIGGLLADTSEPLNARDLDPTSDYGAKTNVGPFGIPFSALHVRGLSNLLVAGRNISATHAALGSMRVMSTCAVMGQAAGTVAALSVAHGSLDDYVAQGLQEAQQHLLRDGCFLPNVVNTDPSDLARTAIVSASSEEATRGVGPQSIDRLGGLDHWRDHPVYPHRGDLSRRTAQWVALGRDGRIDTLSVCLRNTGERPVAVEVSLHKVFDIWDYRIDAPVLASDTLIVEPGGPRWVDWPLAITLDDDASGYVRLDLAAADGVEWVVANAVLPGQVAAYEAAPGLLRRFGGGSTMSFQVSPPQDCYPATHVVSGVTRPYKATNVWRSDPSAPLPQSLRLDWEQPQEIGQVQITFAGNLLREYHASPAFFRDPQTASDFLLEAKVDGSWVEVGACSGNYQARFVHTLDATVTATAFRLTVLATNGDPSAAVSEIRIYSHDVCTPVA